MICSVFKLILRPELRIQSLFIYSSTGTRRVIRKIISAKCEKS